MAHDEARLGLLVASEYMEFTFTCVLALTTDMEDGVEG
jgi:hypothetical protein